MHVDKQCYRLVDGNKSVRLPPAEYLVINKIIAAKGYCVSYDALVMALYSGSTEPDYGTNVARIKVHNLRRLMKKIGTRDKLETIYSEGVRHVTYDSKAVYSDGVLTILEDIMLIA